MQDRLTTIVENARATRQLLERVAGEMELAAEIEKLRQLKSEAVQQAHREYELAQAADAEANGS